MKVEWYKGSRTWQAVGVGYSEAHGILRQTQGSNGFPYHFFLSQSLVIFCLFIYFFELLTESVYYFSAGQQTIPVPSYFKHTQCPPWNSKPGIFLFKAVKSLFIVTIIVFSKLTHFNTCFITANFVEHPLDVKGVDSY